VHQNILGLCIGDNLEDIRIQKRFPPVPIILKISGFRKGSPQFQRIINRRYSPRSSMKFLKVPKESIAFGRE
jgi:hypothetical protein